MRDAFALGWLVALLAACRVHPAGEELLSLRVAGFVKASGIT